MGFKKTIRTNIRSTHIPFSVKAELLLLQSNLYSRAWRLEASKPGHYFQFSNHHKNSGSFTIIVVLYHRRLHMTTAGKRGPDNNR